MYYLAIVFGLFTLLILFNFSRANLRDYVQPEVSFCERTLASERYVCHTQGPCSEGQLFVRRHLALTSGDVSRDDLTGAALGCECGTIFQEFLPIYLQNHEALERCPNKLQATAYKGVPRENIISGVEGYCQWTNKNHPCVGRPANYVYCEEVGDCVRIRSNEYCPSDMIIFRKSVYEGTCDCYPTDLIYVKKLNKCYKRFTKGPCPRGHWITLGRDGETICEKTDCKADGRHVKFGIDGQKAACYELHTTGPCSGGEIEISILTGMVRCSEAYSHSRWSPRRYCMAWTKPFQTGECKVTPDNPCGVDFTMKLGKCVPKYNR